MRFRLACLLALLTVAAMPSTAAAAGKRLRLGALVLHRCSGAAWCGSLPRALDPSRPRDAKIRIGFRWLPASRRDAHKPPIVAVEGGPGYPSIGSRSEYEGTYGPLLRTRNLLLVDNRGTGRSALIDCPDLQNYTGVTSAPNFSTLVEACAHKINSRYRTPSGRRVHASDLFATKYATDDLEAVMRALRLGKVDLYGDSYGTWFVQSFISRYQNRLNSVILDSAYPVRNLDPWYASSGAVARRAMDLACERDAGCSAAAPGSATDRLGQLVERLRNSAITGSTRDADGTKKDATVDIRAVVDMVQDAGSDPVVYRELDASVRAALAGDPVPLLRLTAQSQSWNHGTNPADYFSDGLFFAVACTDYPQLFDMSSSPGDRRSQFGLAVERAPDAFSPFTPSEWLTMSAYSETYQACLDWPKPVHHAPVVPAHAKRSAGSMNIPAITELVERRPGDPLPASIPMLVIGGDLDSLTPLSDAQAFAPTLGANVRVIKLPNTVHVTSEGDTYLWAGAGCARRVIRAFVAAPHRLQSLDASCADRIPPVHTPGAYPLTLTAAAAADLKSGPDPGGVPRRSATVAAGAIADATTRWYYSSARQGPGLRGGTFTVADGNRIRFALKRVRFVTDATVDGSGFWEPFSGRVHGDLVVNPDGEAPVHVTVDWNQRSREALASVDGAALTLPAP